MKLEEKLTRYIDAGFPLIYINSFEEEKVDEMIARVAHRRKIREWSELKGYRTLKCGNNMGDEEEGIESFFEDIIFTPEALNRSLFVIKDVHVCMEDPKFVAKLKSVCVDIGAEKYDMVIILVSSIVKIPKELEKYTVVLDMDYLEETEIRQIIKNFLEEAELHELSEELLEEMTVAFKGLSELEIEKILQLACSSNGEITRNDLELILEQKQQTIKKSGILEMVPLREDMEDIGGLDNLKEWLKRKSVVLKNMNKAKEFGVDLPKGVLIAGVPGCGKSLTAKATAKLLEIPLLRLDMGKIMGKYVGESEENMRNAISLAEAISPCVLWVDELEKAFAGIGGDGVNAELTTRLFGQFLTWMQEKESAVFVVATANKILKLPAELLRKGRFDEIFYVPLPKTEEREKIFSIHIGKRRKVDLAGIDISSLAKASEGYSGAEIEGVVRDSVEDVFVQGRQEVKTEDVLKAIKQTHPLSEIMKKEIEEMEKEYKSRNFKNASK